MALGKLVQIGAKANIWREIQQDGVGLVVEDEVEAIGAGSRGMRALCSAEREAIGRKARNYVIALAAVRKGHSSVAAGAAALDRGRRDCREPREIGFVPPKRAVSPRAGLAASPLGAAEAEAKADASARAERRQIKHKLFIYNMFVSGRAGPRGFLYALRQAPSRRPRQAALASRANAPRRIPGSRICVATARDVHSDRAPPAPW